MSENKKRMSALLGTLTEKQSPASVPTSQVHEAIHPRTRYKNVCFRVSEPMLGKVQAVCRSHGVAFTAVVDVALHLYIEEYERKYGPLTAAAPQPLPDFSQE